MEAERLRQRLLIVDGVRKVDILGEQAQRIYVEFSYQKLATLGITPQTLATALATRNDLVPAGFVDTAGPRVYFRPEGAFAGVEAIASSPLAVGGRTLTIGHIPQLCRGYTQPPPFPLLNTRTPTP